MSARRVLLDLAGGYGHHHIPHTTELQVPMWSDYYRRPCYERYDGADTAAFRCDDEDKCCPDGSDDSPIDGERVDLLRFPVGRCFHQPGPSVFEIILVYYTS